MLNFQAVGEKMTKRLHVDADVCRFSYRGNTMLLVGSKTDYYHHRPAAYSPIHIADVPVR